MNQTKTNIKSTIANWVVYPDEEWIKITPAQAGFDVTKFNQIIVNSHRAERLHPLTKYLQ